MCFGDLDHVKIEPGHFQPCCDTERQPIVVALDGDGRHDHDCVDCSDIPLDIPRWCQRVRIADRPNLRPVGMAQFDSPTDQGIGSGNSLTHIRLVSATEGPAASLSVASTVLLC
jgi:hypothetical protein